MAYFMLRGHSATRLIKEISDPATAILYNAVMIKAEENNNKKH